MNVLTLAGNGWSNGEETSVASVGAHGTAFEAAGGQLRIDDRNYDSSMVRCAMTAGTFNAMVDSFCAVLVAMCAHNHYSATIRLHVNCGPGKLGITSYPDDRSDPDTDMADALNLAARRVWRLYRPHITARSSTSPDLRTTTVDVILQAHRLGADTPIVVRDIIRARGEVARLFAATDAQTPPCVQHALGIACGV